MKLGLWRGKRTLKQWELDRQQDGHHERLKNIRPTSCELDWEPLTLNPNKRLMKQQDKFTEIQRQNRYLLQKITSTMNKSTTKDQDRQKMNRSLNAPFRRKQLQSIQAENARLLKRLKEKKSGYEAQRMKEQWKKQKEVIKNIGHYPFIIRTSLRTGKKRTYSKVESAQDRVRNKSFLEDDIQLVRIRNLNNQNFVISLRLGSEKMRIEGQHKKLTTKVIEIPRVEAMAFVQYQCDGKLQGIFERLSYSPQEDVLYLIGRDGGPGLKTIEEKVSYIEEDRPSPI